MTIPTPSDIARLQTQQRKLAETTPPERVSKSSAKRSTSVASTRSASSPKDKGGPEASSKPSATSPSSETPKKPFVRKPHLTQRPLIANEQLRALRDSLPQNREQNHRGGKPPRFPKVQRSQSKDSAQSHRGTRTNSSVPSGKSGKPADGKRLKKTFPNRPLLSKSSSGFETPPVQLAKSTDEATGSTPKRP